MALPLLRYRSMRCVCSGVIALLLPAVAAAQPALSRPAPPPPASTPAPEVSRVAVVAGIGARRTWLRDARDDAAAPIAILGFRIRPQFAIGVHAGSSRMTGSYAEYGNTYSLEQSWSILAVDLALAVQYREGRFTVTPWLGRHFSRVHVNEEGCSPRLGQGWVCGSSATTEWTNDTTTYGLTLTFGDPRSIPVAFFLDLHTAVGDIAPGPRRTIEPDYSAATIGVAYWQ